MHFEDTEIQMSPMKEELCYWLSAGRTIFRHRGQVWISLRHHKGHRIMIPVDDHTIQELGDRVYFDGMIMKLTDSRQYHKQPEKANP